ncbi:FecR family protein [Paracoccus albus]|uniref:FecR family protein n=1 Tax=Paracoccus albus TaxID=3017784 RepID=UPI0022F04BC9|nr:FecR domain-containing protein [Paracoccus albus]WBU60431.1 FecR domain-containing protein [Paracoccus albus]
MTSDKAQVDQMYREAFELLTRLRDDPGNPALHICADSWRGRGTMYQQVWTRAAGIDFMSRQIVRARQPPTVAKRRLSRRSLFLGGTAATLAAACGTLFLPPLMLRATADHLTTKGEIRNLQLSDGSAVALGPDSAIRVRIDDSTRQVDLLKGMAYFDVAPDPAKPFTVMAGAVSVQVLGTSFDLSIDADSVSVSVERGIVETMSNDMPVPERLIAGDWIAFTEGETPTIRGKREASTIASWRNGMVQVENETVATVVARIARWHDARVVIADPSLRNRRVSGVYNLSQPEAALRAVVAPFGSNVRRISPLMLVISDI